MKVGKVLSSLTILAVFLSLAVSCQVIELILGGDDDTPPVVIITSPAQGATVSGVVPVTATATDTEGVFRVVFYADDLSFAEDRTSPYRVNWDTTALASGTHYLKAVAYDDSGNSADSTVVEVFVQSAGGTYAEGFDGYPLGSTGTLSANMPDDASWQGFTLGTASLSIVDLPAIGVDTPALRLAHGTAEDDTATYLAQVPGMTKGYVQMELSINNISPGALCISLGSGSLLLDTTTTGFFLWLVDTDDGEGTTAAWFSSPTSVAFGEAEIIKTTTHTLKVVFDTTAGSWGAYLDGATLVAATDFAQQIAAVEHVSISTMGLSPVWFGGAFVVDDIKAQADPLISIPQDPGSSNTVLAPTGLAATVEGSAIRLDWTDASDNEDGFFILRGSTAEYDSASWGGIAIVSPDADSYLDDNAEEGITYYYLVASYLETPDGEVFGIPDTTVQARVPIGGQGDGPADGVYVAGAWKLPADAANRAVVWHDDGVSVTRIDLSDGTTASVANDVAVGNTAIYACGYQAVSGGHRAMLWTISPDGTVTSSILKQGSFSVTAKAIALEGTDIYVAGDDFNIDPGIAAVLWKNGTRIQLTPNSAYAAGNDVVAAGGVAFIVGTTDQVNGITFDAHCWVVDGTSLVDQYTLDSNSGTSYGQTAAADDRGLFAAGQIYSSPLYRGTYWLDTGSSITRNVVGSSNVDSDIQGMALKGSTINLVGYEQLEGNMHFAKRWYGGSAATMTGQTLPVPASAGNSSAKSAASNTDAVFIAGYWMDGASMVPCYWTAAFATGRRDLEPAGSGSVKGIALKNPVADYTLPIEPEPEPEPESLPAYPAGVTNTGLVAYYPLTTTAQDGSALGNNGVLYGSPTWTTDRFGSTGSALTLDGVDDYIRVPDSTSLDLSTEWTLSAWVYLPVFASSQEYRIFYKSYYSSSSTFDGGYSMMLANYDSSLLGFFNNVNGSSFSYLLVNGFGTGAWHHLCITGHTSAMKIWGYLDGVRVGDRAISYSSLLSNARDLYIGRAYYASGNQTFYQGSMDDLRIFNRALSDAEVLALYQEGGWE